MAARGKRNESHDASMSPSLCLGDYTVGNTSLALFFSGRFRYSNPLMVGPPWFMKATGA